MKDFEFGKCDICKKEALVNREYYMYDVKCDCCNSKNDNHFEIVRYCNYCIPVPPRKITLYLEPTPLPKQ